MNLTSISQHQISEIGMGQIRIFTGPTCFARDIWVIDQYGNRLELTLWADERGKLELTAYNRNYYRSPANKGESGTL